MRPFDRFKQALRSQQNSSNPIIRLGVASVYAAKSVVMFCTDATYRSIIMVRLTKCRDLHQTTILTGMDRYPNIFNACKIYFNNKLDLRILSYGCSTGEEVLTLRQYFPSAWITGAELNKRNLSLCRKLEVDSRINFVYSDIAAMQQHGPFDAIFCMAVLQRTPDQVAAKRIADLTKIYPFEKFNRQIGELDSLLKKNGLMVVHHTQYLFADASAASKYEPLGGGAGKMHDGLKFDRNSKLLSEAIAVETIFRKKVD